MRHNLTPGFVESYDPDRKTCRVQIPGQTDGAEVLPEAEFCFPVGDKSEHTDIRILKGDRVWLAFINGDARYPVIMGFRPRQTGNETAWRRFHHDNIEHQADTDLHFQAGQDVHIEAGRHVLIEAGGNAGLHAGGDVEVFADGNARVEAKQVLVIAERVTVQSPQTIHTGMVTAQGPLMAAGGLSAVPAAGGGTGATITGGISLSSGTIQVAIGGDVLIGTLSLKGHKHKENGAGGGVTDPPLPT